MALETGRTVPNTKPINTILIAEDEPEVRDYLGVALNCEGYEVEFAQNGEEVVSLLARDANNVSLLLLDLIMPYKDGFETLREVRQNWPALPVITLSGSCTPANVATVLKAGALDFLSKPIGHDDLLRSIQGVLSSANGIRSTAMPEQSAQAADFAFSRGKWPERVNTLLELVSSSDVPVLLRGETGVGKEVLARKLHERSRRAGRPFFKLNCAALPSELVESELFGYERGAFTGALKNTPGKFEMANGGTILLDEIGDMDFKLQAKLLQVLQDKEFFRLGAKETCKVDVRVMAATHCNLEDAMENGCFREDLYYRLNIVEVHVPPLRERKDEIVGLAEFFLRKYAPGETPAISPRFQQVLLEHNWPGNIRELENVIRKFLVFRSVDLIAAELKPKSRLAVNRISGYPATALYPGIESSPVSEHGELVCIGNSKPSADAPSLRVLPVARNVHQGASTDFRQEGPKQSSILVRVDQARKKAEVDAILSALHSTLWNRKQAAKLLNIDYKALLYKMKKLGIGEKTT